MPEISVVIAGCDLLKRRDAESITASLAANDLSSVLAICQEAADECGLRLEMEGSGGTVFLRLTRPRRKGAR